MLSKEEELLIVELKANSPKISFNIKHLERLETANFYYKRLVQLAMEAKNKVEALKTASNGQI